MGYESKIYFVEEYSFPENKIHCSRIISMIDMSKMGYSDTVLNFRKCFDTETTFSLYLDGYDSENEIECMVDTIEDKYGKRLCYASDKERLLDCAIEMEKEDNYRRFKQLRKLLQAFIDDDSVKIVHYGY